MTTPNIDVDVLPEKAEREETAYRVGGTVTWTQVAGQNRRLWDRIDGQWTLPMNSDMVDFTLRKLVAVCNAEDCVHTAILEEGVQGHINRCRQAFIDHGGAALAPARLGNGDDGERCTSCGQTFAFRKQQGQQHLWLIRHEGPRHQAAAPVLVQRFSLEPSELVIGRPHMGAIGTIARPDASPVEGSPRPASTKRRRGRRGGHR